VFDLTEKRAVVTGAASGIGAAVARLFAKAGAAVVAIDLHREKAEALGSEVGERFEAFGCDVSNPESVRAAFVEITTRDTRVDILVNCAGIAHVGNLESTTPEDFDRLYAVNVRGTYLMMRAVLEPMRRGHGGVIVNLASIAATSGISDRFSYSMTKGAVRAMTLSVAKDFIGEGIRCNCISPARVHTPFVDGFLAKEYPGRESKKMKELAAAQPIGRMGTSEEIAQLALYLCSDESSFVTGADYLIDGGWTNVR
jgi:NAD(P)-dependent dehydrogenase (short-subunit alcohol dehydrogenase family)